MKNTSLVLSRNLESNCERTLFKIATLANKLGFPPLLFGATARDVIFFNKHGIESKRRTMDADISVQLSDWKKYDDFGIELRKIGFSNPDDEHYEKFVDGETGQEVDIVPFGAIAQDGVKIVWPNGESEWSVIGFEDALKNAWSLSVKGDGDKSNVISVISVPAFVMLKIIAMNDRPEDRHHKDGADISFVIKHYLEIENNKERLRMAPHDDILNNVDSDLEFASAVLLGRDIKDVASFESCKHVCGILDHEIESSSRCYLARSLKDDLCKGSYSRAR